MTHPTRTRQRRLAMYATAVCISLPLTACSSSADTAPSGSGSSLAPAAGAGQNTTASDAQVVKLPIDKYSLHGSGLEVVEGAVQKVVAECMQKLDQPYERYDVTKDTESKDENRRYGIQDASWATAHGYRPYSVVHPPEPDPTAKQYPQSVVTALSGRDEHGQAVASNSKAANGRKIPRDGCQGEADRTVRVPYDYPEGVEVARTIYFDGFKESLSDTRVKKVFRQWSSCMTAKGFSYDSPLDAMGSQEFAEGSVTDHEREVARADIRCKNEVGLIPRWNTAEADIETRMINKRSDVLEKFLQLQTKKIQAARRLLNH